jgi:hypothetical protein
VLVQPINQLKVVLEQDHPVVEVFALEDFVVQVDLADLVEVADENE